MHEEKGESSRFESVAAIVLLVTLCIGFSGIVIVTVTALGASFWPFVDRDMLYLAIGGSAMLTMISLLLGMAVGQMWSERMKKQSVADEDIQPTKPRE